MAMKQQTSTRPTMENKNVYDGPLTKHSSNPPTGFFRDGYCRTGPDDKGNHVIAATVNDAFLDFSASQGNNLRDVGVKSGMKWCLCTARWKEAMKAAGDGKLKQEDVPKVSLGATDKSALENGVTLKDLKRYTAGKETAKEGVQSRQDASIQATSGGRGMARETTEMTDPETAKKTHTGIAP